MSKVIATHSGTFHCDECLACYLLHQTTEFEGAEIVRTRDPEVIKNCDIVVDVGGVYDPSKNLFDHHQRGFFEVFSDNFKTKLSSAGLVYKHFGEEIIKNMSNIEEKETIDLLYKKVYKKCIEGIDAIDNGIDQYDCDQDPKYLITSNLSSRVGRLNKNWNDDESVDQYQQFLKGVEMAGIEFQEILDNYVKSWLPARNICQDLFTKRFDVVETGEIVILETGCPWKSHLFEIEEKYYKETYPDISDSERKQLMNEKGIKYCIFESNGDWRITTVPVSPSSFTSRLPFPEAWRGIRNEELSKLTNIEGCIFIHAAGFTGGNKTKDGVIEMAIKSLEINKNNNNN